MPWLMHVALLAAVLFAALPAPPAAAATNSAVALRARHAALGEALRHNAYQRSLYLESADSTAELQGDIYALVEHPFAAVDAALNGPGRWCDILILSINTKHCRVLGGRDGPLLAVSIGKKSEQPVDEAYRIEFAYRVVTATPDYLEVRLDAAAGPLGTSDYRILFEAIPIDAGHSFLHFRYAYAYGLTGRLAMQVYLATAGRDKRGFTVVGRQADGSDEQISGMRGVVERNTMRYFLAIDAWLGAPGDASDAMVERRLRGWFAAAERYPRQLHEMGQAEYLEMKRNETRRQQSLQQAGQ